MLCNGLRLSTSNKENDDDDDDDGISLDLHVRLWLRLIRFHGLGL